MISQVPLPYERTLFNPSLSKETIDFHYDKHHLGYIRKLRQLVINTQYEEMPLEKIIIQSCHDKMLNIFNNAAQIWNHNFYWKSLSLNKHIPSQMLQMIQKYFSNTDQLKKQIIKEGMLLFGSGWVWLVQSKKDKSLSIKSTTNANNLLSSNFTPLLTIDVWEHAYYIDYRNNREKYLTNIVEYLNWNFANQNSIK